MNPLHTDDLLILNQLPIINKINAFKVELDALRPISKEQEGRIMQKFRLDWNYNSNAIEGNSLDYGETVAFLMHGVTAKGKPLKDYLDIRGHNEAIDYLLDLIRNKEQLGERDIRGLHQMLLVEPYDSPAQTQEGIVVRKRIKLGQYKTTPNHVKTITGEIHYYATPEDTPMLMSELVDWYRKTTAESVLHPVVIAAIFHHRFASIHPFDDGNGRMSRLLMNLILMQYEYPPVVIRNDKKDEYYLVLSQADIGDLKGFVDYIGQYMLHSLDIYIKGAKGESIEEALDLDKRLQLFKREVEARKDRVELRRSPETKLAVAESSFKPLLTSYTIMLSKFKDMFLAYEDYILGYRKNLNRKGLNVFRWSYNLLDLIGFANSIDSSMISEDTTIIASTFDKFKLESNHFSLEVKLGLVFNELEYQIYYSVARGKEIEDLETVGYNQWLGKAKAVKYYHQALTKEEIDEHVQQIGNDLFDAVEKMYNGPLPLYIRITEEELINAWNDFCTSNSVFTLVPDDLLRKVNSFEVNGNIITIDLSEGAFNAIASKRAEFEDGFSNYLLNNKHINTRGIVEIV